MTVSFYAIALAFFQATDKPTRDSVSEKFTELACAKALGYLMLDFSFAIVLDKGTYVIKYESGKTVRLLSAKQTLRFLSVNHRNSSIWYPQQQEEVVFKLALAMANLGRNEYAVDGFMDEAARRLVNWHLQEEKLVEKAKAHWQKHYATVAC